MEKSIFNKEKEAEQKRDELDEWKYVDKDKTLFDYEFVVNLMGDYDDSFVINPDDAGDVIKKYTNSVAKCKSFYDTAQTLLLLQRSSCGNISLYSTRNNQIRAGKVEGCGLDWNTPNIEGRAKDRTKSRFLVI